MAENNKKTMGTMLFAEIGCMLFAAAAIAGICLSGLVKYGIDRMIGLIVFVVLGIAIVGFGLRRGLLIKDLDYDN